MRLPAHVGVGLDQLRLHRRQPHRRDTSANANLTNTDLTNANLTGANLTGATGLPSATVAGVVWSNTTCPDGTNSDANTNTCVGH